MTQEDSSHIVHAVTILLDAFNRGEISAEEYPIVKGLHLLSERFALLSGIVDSKFLAELYMKDNPAYTN